MWHRLSGLPLKSELSYKLSPTKVTQQVSKQLAWADFKAAVHIWRNNHEERKATKAQVSYWELVCVVTTGGLGKIWLWHHLEQGSNTSEQDWRAFNKRSLTESIKSCMGEMIDPSWISQLDFCVALGSAKTEPALKPPSSQNTRDLHTNPKEHRTAQEHPFASLNTGPTVHF